MIHWYTLENGRLCLGTNEATYANFHIATQVKLKQAVCTPLTQEHIDVIGSFPEDWYNDEQIDQTINNTARHFFELYSASFPAEYC